MYSSLGDLHGVPNVVCVPHKSSSFLRYTSRCIQSIQALGNRHYVIKVYHLTRKIIPPTRLAYISSKKLRFSSTLDVLSLREK